MSHSESTRAIGCLLMQKLAGEITEQELFAGLEPLVKEAASADTTAVKKIGRWFNPWGKRGNSRAIPKALYTTLGMSALGLGTGAYLGNRQYLKQAYGNRGKAAAQGDSHPSPSVFAMKPDIPSVPALPGYYPTGMIDTRIPTNSIQ